jgi:hypothetical protein
MLTGVYSVQQKLIRPDSLLTEVTHLNRESLCVQTFVEFFSPETQILRRILCEQDIGLEDGIDIIIV